MFKTTVRVNLYVYLQSLWCELFQSFESKVKNCFDSSLSPHVFLNHFFWTVNEGKVIWKINMIDKSMSLFEPGSLMLYKA